MKKILAILMFTVGSAVAAHAAHPVTSSSHQTTATSYHAPKTYSKAAVAHR